MGTLFSKRCFSFAALDILCFCMRLFYMGSDMTDRDALVQEIKGHASVGAKCVRDAIRALAQSAAPEKTEPN
jgi:hypothetical protein